MHREKAEGKIEKRRRQSARIRASHRPWSRGSFSSVTWPNHRLCPTLAAPRGDVTPNPGQWIRLIAFPRASSGQASGSGCGGASHRRHASARGAPGSDLTALWRRCVISQRAPRFHGNGGSGRYLAGGLGDRPIPGGSTGRATTSGLRRRSDCRSGDDPHDWRAGMIPFPAPFRMPESPPSTPDLRSPHGFQERGSPDPSFNSGPITMKSTDPGVRPALRGSLARKRPSAPAPFGGTRTLRMGRQSSPVHRLPGHRHPAGLGCFLPSRVPDGPSDRRLPERGYAFMTRAGGPYLTDRFTSPDSDPGFANTANWVEMPGRLAGCPSGRPAISG